MDLCTQGTVELAKLLSDPRYFRSRKRSNLRGLDCLGQALAQGETVAHQASRDEVKPHAAPDVTDAHSTRPLTAIFWVFTLATATSPKVGETSVRCRSSAVMHGRVSGTRQGLLSRQSCQPPACSPSPESDAPRSRAPQSTGLVCFRSMGLGGNTSAKSSLSPGSRRSLTSTPAISPAGSFIRTAAGSKAGGFCRKSSPYCQADRPAAWWAPSRCNRNGVGPTTPLPEGRPGRRRACRDARCSCDSGGDVDRPAALEAADLAVGPAVD
jgi:hypothetical protein